MPGIAELALAGAPIAGGALFGLVAGNFRGPDIRATVKADLELLTLLPTADVARREELQRVIDLRVDDLIAGVDRGRRVRSAAMSYEGNWRDLVVLVCVILFAIVWWNVDHGRSNWLLTFVVLIALAMLAALYAARGILRTLMRYRRPPS